MKNSRRPNPNRVPPNKKGWHLDRPIKLHGGPWTVVEVPVSNGVERAIARITPRVVWGADVSPYHITEALECRTMFDGWAIAGTPKIVGSTTLTICELI